MGVSSLVLAVSYAVLAVSCVVQLPIQQIRSWSSSVLEDYGDDAACFDAFSRGVTALLRQVCLTAQVCWR